MTVFNCFDETWEVMTAVSSLLDIRFKISWNYGYICKDLNIQCLYVLLGKKQLDGVSV